MHKIYLPEAMIETKKFLDNVSEDWRVSVVSGDKNYWLTKDNLNIIMDAAWQYMHRLD